MNLIRLLVFPMKTGARKSQIYLENTFAVTLRACMEYFDCLLVHRETLDVKPMRPMEPVPTVDASPN